MFTTLLLIVSAVLLTQAMPRRRRNSLLASSRPVGPFKSVAGSGNQHIKDNINTYSMSPAEAYFGSAAHTHSLPIETTAGLSPWQHEIKIGGPLDWHMENELVPSKSGFKHDQTLGLDHFGSKKPGDGGVDYGKHFQDYRDQLSATHAAQGTNPHPHLMTPTAFLGKSPFHHELGLETGEHATALTHGHNINGLTLFQKIQPAANRATHGHQLPGIDGFKSFDHDEHFTSFVPHHANHAGTSDLAKGSSTKEVQNPNLDSSHIDQWSPANSPRTIQRIPSNPFVNARNPFVATDAPPSRFQQYAARFL